MKYDKRYVGRLGRPELRAMASRFVHGWRRNGPHNALFEFEDDTLAVCPMRTMRKVNP